MSPRSVRMGAIAALVLLAVTWPIAQGTQNVLAHDVMVGFRLRAARQRAVLCVGPSARYVLRGPATQGRAHHLQVACKTSRDPSGRQQLLMLIPSLSGKRSTQSSIGDSEAVTVEQVRGKSKGGRLLLAAKPGSSASAPLATGPSAPSATGPKSKAGSNQPAANAPAQAAPSGGGRSKPAANAPAASKTKGGRLLLAAKLPATAVAVYNCHTY
ncbi:hypothetical protein V8C86DRAFT_2433038 [Haematococcus lacustris]